MFCSIRGTQLENADADAEAKFLICDICISQSNPSIFGLFECPKAMFSRSKCRSDGFNFELQVQKLCKVFFELMSLIQFTIWSSWGMVSSGLSILQANGNVLVKGILNGIHFVACFMNYFKSEALMEKELPKSLDSLCLLVGLARHLSPCVVIFVLWFHWDSSCLWCDYFGMPKVCISAWVSESKITPDADAKIFGKKLSWHFFYLLGWKVLFLHLRLHFLIEYPYILSSWLQKPSLKNPFLNAIKYIPSLSPVTNQFTFVTDWCLALG
jgi:hypothetical protein